MQGWCGCTRAPENKRREEAQTNPLLSNGRLSAALPRILRRRPLCRGVGAAPCAETVSAWRAEKKEQASLGRDEIPFSAILYLHVAPAPSPDEIRKVGQWRAKEGCGAGTLEAEKGGR